MEIINTKDKKESTSLALMVYGQAGTGKTTFAATAKDVLFLDTEQSTKALGLRGISVDVIEIKSFPNRRELSELEDILKKGSYKTVVIDTVDVLIDRMINDYALFPLSKKHRQADGSLTMAGWGDLFNKIKNFVRFFKDSEIDVVLLCHEKEDKSQEGQQTLRPNLSASILASLSADVDVIGIAKSAEDPQTKKQEFFIVVKPSSEIIVSKDRFGFITKWQEETEKIRIPADYESFRKLALNTERKKDKTVIKKSLVEAVENEEKTPENTTKDVLASLENETPKTEKTLPKKEKTTVSKLTSL